MKEVIFQAKESVFKKHLLALLLMSTLTIIAYASGLKGPWLMDDRTIFDTFSFASISDFIGGRRLALFSFYLNERIMPFEPLYFRLVNITIHIINSILVYALAYRTIRIYQRQITTSVENSKGYNGPFLFALASGLFFALHPININAVTYIIQRMASLATLFALTGLHLYISASLSETLTKKFVYYTASAVSLIAAISSKETSIVIVGLVLLYDLFFISSFNLRLLMRKILIIVILTAIMILIASHLYDLPSHLKELINIFSKPDTPLPKVGWTAMDVSWTPVQHVLTEFRVLCRYLIIIFLPLPAFLAFDAAGYPVSLGLFEPITTAISVLALGLLLGFALLKARSSVFLSFGILWFFVGIFIESFLLVGIDLYFEHRNYLPLAGISVALSLYLKRVVDSYKPNMKTLIAILCIVVGLLGLSTAYRNHTYSDPIRLFSDTLHKNPTNQRAMLALATYYQQKEDFRVAEGIFNKIANYPNSVVLYSQIAMFQLTKIYIITNRNEEALGLIGQFHKSGENAKETILRAFYNLHQARIEEAIVGLINYKGDMLDYEILAALHILAEASYITGQYEVALDYSQKALGINRGNVDALINIARVYVKKGDIERAERLIRRAHTIEPLNIRVTAILSYIMLIKGDIGDATRYAELTKNLNPSSYRSDIAMGDIYLFNRQEDKARLCYQEAIKKGAPQSLVTAHIKELYGAINKIQ